MRSLSRTAQGLIGQPMFGLLAKARSMEAEGRRIIHFEIGDPSSPSPTVAIEAAKTALDAGMTHYTDSMGTRQFREAIQDYIESNYGFRPSLDQILVCPANAIIDFAARCLVNPREEVIYPDPGFPTYYSVINYNGMVPVPVALKEENKFRMSPDDVRSSVTDRTRLIIINTPHNPTGAVMSRDEVLEVAHIAQEHDIPLLSDEVYAKAIYDGKHHSPSVVDRCEERTIILNSLSKVYSMSGWRLGYAVAPVKLAQKMGLLLQTILSCLPAFTQAGGAAALHVANESHSDNLDELRKRRNVLVEGLNSVPGVSCIVPDGAFYAFADITRTGMTSDEYSEWLLKKTGVCVLPGSCFGDSGHGYIRLCYASVTVPLIEEAVQKMRRFHERLCPATPIGEYARTRNEAPDELASSLAEEMPERA